MIKPKQVFLGCPFKKRVGSYIHLAEDVAEQYGAHLVFGDNNPQASNIRDQAFRLISSSRVIILDVSPDNVNVGIEYGYSQGVDRKNTYLLVRKPLFEDVQLPAMLHGLQYKTYRSLLQFRDRVEQCLAQHYKKSYTAPEPDDPSEQVWLQDQILNLIDDIRSGTRHEIADALNCAPTEITSPANKLADEGKLRRETNGPVSTYFSLTTRSLVRI